MSSFFSQSGRKASCLALLRLALLVAAGAMPSLADGSSSPPVEAAIDEAKADVNKDGKVSSIDLGLAARRDPRADVNGDGKVSSIDLSQIAQVMARRQGTLQGRDKYKQPFASDSPWNMPIGSGAVYVPAGIGKADWTAAEIDYIYTLRATDPLRPLLRPVYWGEGRCTEGARSEGIDLPIPDTLIVPDVDAVDTPNNAAAFLMPDGRTYVQVNALARCAEGGPVFGVRGPDESIYGQGIRGGHGGSGLSSVGGAIRKDELTGPEPIKHALKVNLWCARYCSFASDGYRWPAQHADAYASPTSYGGPVPALRMGSLLALPPTVTESGLGLETEPGRKLFRAFQDYGAYVADDAHWDAHAIAVENGVLEQFSSQYGFTFEDTRGPFYRDVQKLFQALSVVDNNTATTVGGGGATRRQPLAPALGN